jgi:hypothetical protein
VNDLKASARDSEFVLLKPEAVAARPDSLEAAVDVATAGLKRPVHSLGVVQAFGAAASLASSVALGSASDTLVFVASSPSVPDFCGSSTVCSGAGLGASRGMAFGIAGTTGTVDLCNCFGATGVVSRSAELEFFCIEDGVVGLVDSVFSDAGWLVEGVSGRGISMCAVSCCSTSDAGSSSGVVPCAITGSSTGSADNCGVAFRFLRARFAGQGRSGLESQGNCFLKLEILK